MDPKAANPAAATLERKLLEFRAAPSRYALGEREPALLFSSLDEVIQLAIGRDDETAPASEAARFFIRRALFPAGAHHYTLLGLQRAAAADDIKKRYRLLMRLLHPDFANDAADWRTDAAVRVNVAYETLSSPARRIDYDSELAAPPPRVAAPPQMPPRRPHVRRQPTNFRGPAARVAMAASFAAAMVLLAVLFVTNQEPSTELVQREPGSRPAPARSALDVVVQAAQDLTAAVRGEPVEQSAPLPPAKDEIARVGTSDAPPPVQTPAGASIAEPAQRTAPEPAPPLPAPVSVAAVGPEPMATPPAPAGPSIADAQPLLLQLLQRMESGNGDELLAVLERPSRGSQDAQALAREFTQLAQGNRARIAGVQFRGEPREGRLLVRGAIKLRVDESSPQPLDFNLLAEFVQRDGAVVLTRLAPANR